MNSLERIRAAVALGRSDRTPVVPQVFGHAAALARVPLGEYVRDGGVLARCQLEALSRYRYDAVFSVMGTNVEAEAAGCVLEYRPEAYPIVKGHVFGGSIDVSSATIPDPQKDGRMPEILGALGLLRRELRDEVLVVGCVLGPLTVATQLAGIERALFLAVDDFPRFEALLDYAVEISIGFGLAQVTAGAHVVMVFDPSASPAVIPPRLFRELEAPRLKRIFTAFSSAGALANWLHIAGLTTTILPLYEQMGTDIANFDYCVSAEVAQTQLPATCLDGNIRSLAFVDSSPEAIKKESMNLIEAFRDRGGFILSSGCEIPPESAPENVAAMVQAALEGTKQ